MPITHHPARKLPWKADLRTLGKGRLFFATKAQAKAAEEEALGQRKSAGESWLKLEAHERNELIDVYAKCRNLGISLRELVALYERGEIKVSSSVSLQTAIKETITAKRGGKRRERYVKGLEAYLELFAKGREAMPVNRIRTADIERWFEERQEKPGTRASNLGRLQALFGLCYRRKYIVENPCNFVEKVTVDRKPPKILTPEQASTAIDYCVAKRPDWIPWFILSVMVGVRPSEFAKLKWSAVCLKRKIVTIAAEGSKVRFRRIAEIEPAAIPWLELGGKLPVPEITRKRWQREMAGVLGFEEWPQDVLRHTAASYLLARHQDAQKVSLWLGNSPKILFDHYRELVDKENNGKFWGIEPNKVTAFFPHHMTAKECLDWVSDRRLIKSNSGWYAY